MRSLKVFFADTVREFLYPWFYYEARTTDLLSPEESLDEAIDESFPASDPPGHFSKSTEDRVMHLTPYCYISRRTLETLEQIPPRRHEGHHNNDYTNLGSE